MAAWTSADIPDLTGRVALVTGANSGLGFQTARALAGHGAATVLGCRDQTRAQRAVAAITAEHPGARVEVLSLDLAALASVRAAAERFAAEHDRLDLLVNNAGVMAVPRRLTADGFEMQLGTNHLGHFALTGLLLDPLLDTAASRVVNVSSRAHTFGRIDFDDLMGERRYQRWRAYGQSKLANLLFTYELQRRLSSAGAGTIAVAAHPGYAATNLQVTSAHASRLPFADKIFELGNRVFAQSDEQGALPQLRAATDPGVVGGDYYGPGGFRELRGSPVRVASSSSARDQAAAARLWERSEELTGVTYDRLRRV